jgi:hypothetical protein
MRQMNNKKALRTRKRMRILRAFRIYCLHDEQEPPQAPQEAQPPQEDLPDFLSRIMPRRIRATAAAITRIRTILIRFAASHASMKSLPCKRLGDPGEKGGNRDRREKEDWQDYLTVSF